MAQIVSFLNIIVIAVVIGAAVFWAGSPPPPKPLPNDAQFVAQIHEPGTVLVKFGAKWCGPCRQIEEELDHLPKSGADQVKVVKIDIDENRALAAHYGISSIPHLMLFQNGKQVGEARGYRSREQLKTWIAKNCYQGK